MRGCDEIVVVGEDAVVATLVRAELRGQGFAISSRADGEPQVLADLAAGSVAAAVLVRDEQGRQYARAVSSAPGLAERVVQFPSKDLVTIEDLIQRLQLRHGMEPQPLVVDEVAAESLSALGLIGAALTVKPTLKLTFEGPDGAVGLCLCQGKIRAIGLRGNRFLARPTVKSDPSLELLLSLWASGRGEITAAQELDADLGFMCEHGDLVAPMSEFMGYAVEVLSWLMTHPIDRIRFEPHHPAQRGLDLAIACLGALEQQGEAWLREIVGDSGLLHAPDGLPKQLRPALPPRRYGQLFFGLRDALSLDEALTHYRGDANDALASLALGVVAGGVRSVQSLPPEAAPPSISRPRESPPPPRSSRPPSFAEALGLTPRRTYPQPVPTPPPLPTPKPMSGPLAPAKNPNGPATRDRKSSRVRISTLQGRPARCGAPEQFLEALRGARKRGEGKGKSLRVRGTRFEPVGERQGDLILFYRVGTGGMGDVFLGVQGGHASFQKVVAIKRINREMTGKPERLEMFLNEARLSATLQHPNIVQIFSLARFERRYAILMEFVHGLTVSDFIRRLAADKRRMEPSLVAWIGAEVARGLDYAHGQVDVDGRPLGLIHRDIANPNIMLGFDGSVKVIDFGIAGTADPKNGVIALNSRSGRLGNMAPEVLAGSTVGPGADQFSLGVALYTMLTGVKPFRGSPDQVVSAIAGSDFVGILDLRPDAPPRLAYAIERALSPVAADRFDDCAALRKALLFAIVETGDPTGDTTDAVRAVLGKYMRHEMEAIAQMRRCAASVLASDGDAGTVVGRSDLVAM